jgi:hypothetical protein
MIKLTSEFLRTELQTDKYKDYIEEFPHLEDKIENFREKPNCPTCLAMVEEGLLVNITVTRWKMAKIYNSNSVHIDLTTTKPKSVTWKQQVEVHSIPFDEYEEWAKILFEQKPHPSPQVKTYNTFYKPDDNIVVVTALMLVPVEE